MIHHANTLDSALQILHPIIGSVKLGPPGDLPAPLRCHVSTGAALLSHVLQEHRCLIIFEGMMTQVSRELPIYASSDLETLTYQGCMTL